MPDVEPLLTPWLAAVCVGLTLALHAPRRLWSASGVGLAGALAGILWIEFGPQDFALAGLLVTAYAAISAIRTIAPAVTLLAFAATVLLFGGFALQPLPGTTAATIQTAAAVLGAWGLVIGFPIGAIRIADQSEGQTNGSVPVTSLAILLLMPRLAGYLLLEQIVDQMTVDLAGAEQILLTVCLLTAGAAAAAAITTRRVTDLLGWTSALQATCWLYALAVTVAADAPASAIEASRSAAHLLAVVDTFALLGLVLAIAGLSGGMSINPWMQSYHGTAGRERACSLATCFFAAAVVGMAGTPAFGLHTTLLSTAVATPLVDPLSSLPYPHTGLLFAAGVIGLSTIAVAARWLTFIAALLFEVDRGGLTSEPLALRRLILLALIVPILLAGLG